MVYIYIIQYYTTHHLFQATSCASYKVYTSSDKVRDCEAEDLLLHADMSLLSIINIILYIDWIAYNIMIMTFSLKKFNIIECCVVFQWICVHENRR